MLNVNDLTFSIEVKKLLDTAMYDIDDFDIEFLIEQASYMSSVERKFFFEVLQRLVGMEQ